MYESTLRQARSDADQLFYPLAAVMATAALGKISDHISPGLVIPRRSIRNMVDAIPSATLSEVDAWLVSTIKPARHENELAPYQMVTILNGLIYVRIIEVAKPKFARRSHVYKENALDFMEPHFAVGMHMLGTQEQQADSWRDQVTKALQSEGLAVTTDVDPKTFCVNAIHEVVLEIRRRSSAGGDSKRYAFAWSCGLLAMIFASHLARLSGAQFELMASSAIAKSCLVQVGIDKFEQLHTSVVASYNRMTTAMEIIPDIGSNFARWLIQQDEEGFAMLVEAYDYIVQIVEIQYLTEVS
ncbi:MAG: hypothetical protein SH859_13295 [Hyphomicrobium aestuarii]|nr:hypothetical protein [Hyphomicrobium aestuarii]